MKAGQTPGKVAPCLLSASPRSFFRVVLTQAPRLSCQTNSTGPPSPSACFKPSQNPERNRNHLCFATPVNPKSINTNPQLQIIQPQNREVYHPNPEALPKKHFHTSTPPSLNQTPGILTSGTAHKSSIAPRSEASRASLSVDYALGAGQARPVLGSGMLIRKVYL